MGCNPACIGGNIGCNKSGVFLWPIPIVILVVRRMPTGFRVMHPSSGDVLAELLLNLSAELKQGASYISHVPSLPKVKVLAGDMRMAVAMLYRHINLLESPLYRLPSDLFLEVASHLTREADLVKATHVSHHLRDTLLSFPRLWSHLNFKRETRARGFFERSGQASLHVDMASDPVRTVASLAELRKQSNRIATLKLRNWSIQKMFLSEPLPSMRSLEIISEDPDNGWEEWEGQWDITWAPVWGPTNEATSWSFPSLTSLIIRGHSLKSFAVPNLTRFGFWDREGLTNTEKLVSFLGNCPRLEHIDMTFKNMYSPKPNLVVSLPSLRTYTQTSCGGVCSLIVSNMLSLPPSCSVTLRSQEYDEWWAEADGILCFKNPDYLAKIKRVKLGASHNNYGLEMAGTLELVNAKGAKVCSEREFFSVIGDSYHFPNVAHLDFLRDCDGRSVEVLCIDGHTSEEVGGVTIEFLKVALGFGSVRTLILSRNAVGPCLLALDEDPGTSDLSRWSLPIHTLIIDQRCQSHDEVLQPLLSVAQKRKVAGFPFRSVSLFFHGDPQRDWDEVSDELRKSVEKLEVFMRDDALDWDVDKYFLDGLEHLQKNKDVEWGW